MGLQIALHTLTVTMVSVRGINKNTKNKLLKCEYCLALAYYKIITNWVAETCLLV